MSSLFPWKLLMVLFITQTGSMQEAIRYIEEFFTERERKLVYAAIRALAAEAAGE